MSEELVEIVSVYTGGTFLDDATRVDYINYGTDKEEIVNVQQGQSPITFYPLPKEVTKENYE